MFLPYINMNLPQVHACSPYWTPSNLPPHTIPLGRLSAPGPSIQYHALNLDWQLVSYMILYIFQCRSPKSSHKVREESEKVGLKLIIQKTKTMASGPITSQQIDGETVETVSDFIWGGAKSLQMVIGAMKLKDAYSLKEKLWPT